MPTRYEGYVSPHAGTIADLILRRGEQSARSTENLAAIQARAAETRGNAWAGAVGSIGEIARGIPLQIAENRERQSITAARDARTRLETDSVDRAAQGEKMLQESIARHRTEEGTDFAAVAADVAQFDPDAATKFLTLAEKTKAGRDALKAQKLAAAKEAARIEAEIADSAETPEDFLATVGLYHADGLIDDATVANITQAIQSQPWEALKPRIVGRSPEYQAAAATRKKDAEELAKTEAETAKIKNQPAEKPPNVGSLEDFLVKKYGPTPSAAQIVSGRREFEAAGRAPQPADEIVELSPEGQDAAAMMFAKTGTLPPMGTGKAAAAARTKVINRAAVLMPGLDVASAKADFGANQDSLKKLQGQRDAIGAFEETALKNLDIFIETAKKITDTGSPFFNKPIRAIQESGLGSAELTAFNTARRTVIPEFAKILANPGLSGQLSDSARHEVEEVVSGNATLKQTLAAADILKRDAANRRSSYDDQIAAIRQRISKATTPENENNGMKPAASHERTPSTAVPAAKVRVR